MEKEMKKINLEQYDLQKGFIELSEQCQLAVDGGCGSFAGGSVVGDGSMTFRDYFRIVYGR